MRRAWPIPVLAGILWMPHGLSLARASSAPDAGKSPAQQTSSTVALDMDLIRRGLSAPTDSPEFRGAAETVARPSSIDPALLPDLITAANRAPANQKPDLLRAVGSTRTRAGAEYLVSLLETPSVDAALRLDVVRSLRRSTGRDDLGESAPAWRGLLDQHPTEADWSRAALGWVGQAADGLRQHQETVEARLLAAMRALHLATPADKRWPLISSMLADALPCVNLLGLELLARELSAGNRPDGGTGREILSLLKSPEPAIREQAAILIANLAPEDAIGALRGALAVETVPSAGAALLRAASRWPSEATERAVLRFVDPAVWAASGPIVRDASVDAAWALYRAGELRSPATARQCLDALRTISIADLNGAGCRLRAELGDQSDLDDIVLLLGSKNPEQRLATAEALVIFPEYLPRILAAAREDPLLIDIAVRGVVTLAPDVANFSAIEEATRKMPDLRRSALTVIASVLNEDEIIEASRRLRSDPALREAVLASLADPRRIMAERTDPARLSFTAQALLELAELRIELGKPGEAIAALDSLSEIASYVPAEQLRDTRVLAYIGANRLEQARELGAGPGVWLGALERYADQPQAGQIASAIETGMGEALTPADRAKLEQLKFRIARPR